MGGGDGTYARPFDGELLDRTAKRPGRDNCLGGASMSLPSVARSGARGSATPWRSLTPTGAERLSAGPGREERQTYTFDNLATGAPGNSQMPSGVGSLPEGAFADKLQWKKALTVAPGLSPRGTHTWL